MLNFTVTMSLFEHRLVVVSSSTPSLRLILKFYIYISRTPLSFTQLIPITSRCTCLPPAKEVARRSCFYTCLLVIPFTRRGVVPYPSPGTRLFPWKEHEIRQEVPIIKAGGTNPTGMLSCLDMFQSKFDYFGYSR